MSILETNFDAVKEAYKSVFEALERALLKFDIDFYLIGAQSRDVWTNHIDMEKRVSRDIDYFVLINDTGTWSELNTYLIETEKFERDKDQPYRFYLEEHTIDLIPFGGIENNGEVVLDNPPMELSVYGSKEVAEEAEIIHGKYKVVTLPGLCILKLVAYNEKPDSRAKDWQDMLLILRNYSEIAGAQLFDGFCDDLIEGNFEFKVASARMLGRHMNVILRKNDGLKERVIEILSGKLMNFKPVEIDQMYQAKDRDDTQIETLKLLCEVIKGIND